MPQTGTITDSQLEKFFTLYGEGLENFDAEAIARLWGLPAMRLSDSEAFALTTRESLASFLAAPFPLLRLYGLGGVRFRLTSREDVTDRLVRVRVQWLFDDVEGSLVTDISYDYTLRAEADELLAYVSVSLDEDQKIAEVSAKLDGVG